jgi:hypothetical protein
VLTEISDDRVLGVLADFDAHGGASCGLVAWDLMVAEEAIVATWLKASSATGSRRAHATTSTTSCFGG